MKGTVLKISEPPEEDFGKSVARIPGFLMEGLGVREGEWVEIEGTRRTCAEVRRAEDNACVLRLSGIARGNSGLRIGDLISLEKIRKIVPSKAGKVVLGIDGGNALKGEVNRIKNSMLGMCVHRNQEIILNISIPAIALRGIRAVVEKTEPEGYVMVGRETEIEVRDKRETSFVY